MKITKVFGSLIFLIFKHIQWYILKTKIDVSIKASTILVRTLKTFRHNFFLNFYVIKNPHDMII